METITTDVLIIGAGAAGIRAALAASTSGCNVLVLAKGGVGRSGSTFSNISKGWGIQALLGKEKTDKSLEEQTNENKYDDGEKDYTDYENDGIDKCSTQSGGSFTQEERPMPGICFEEVGHCYSCDYDNCGNNEKANQQKEKFEEMFHTPTPVSYSVL